MLTPSLAFIDDEIELEAESSEEEIDTKPSKKVTKKASKKKEKAAFSFDFDDGQVCSLSISGNVISSTDCFHIYSFNTVERSVAQWN